MTRERLNELRYLQSRSIPGPFTMEVGDDEIPPELIRRYYTERFLGELGNSADELFQCVEKCLDSTV